MKPRKVTCRYTKSFGHLCTGEAVDPDAEVLLCTAHLAAAYRLFSSQASPDARGARRSRA